MAAILRGVRLRRRLGEAAGRFTSLRHAAEYELASLHVDLRALESCLQPHLRHHVVIRVVAPPRAMMLRLRRQLHADDLLDLAEGQRHLARALPAQKLSEG